MKRVTLICIATGLLGLLTACGSQPAPAAEPQSVPMSTKTPATTTEPVAFKKDGKLWCPLMNKEIKSEADAKGFVDHEGTRYFFCCDMCVKNGKADGAKVAAAAAALK